MIAADENGLQDWAVDYDGEGQEWVAREGRDSRLARMAAAKMAAAVDSGGERQQQWWWMMAVDNGSQRQWHARLGGGLQWGRLRAGSKKQQHYAEGTEKGMLFLAGVIHFFDLTMLFLAGIVLFFVWGFHYQNEVLLT